MLKVAKANWFYLLLPILLAAAFGAARSPEALTDPLLTERVLLVDAFISLPLLYWLYLRSRVTTRAALIRCVALALSGSWVAGWLLQGEGQILPWLSWLRAIALPIFIILEAGPLIAVVRYTFGANPQEDKLLAQGLPPLAVKLMLAEARFWKKVWRLLSGR